MKWFGHVNRMTENRAPKQCMEAKMEGKKTRGRQRKTYMDEIEKAGRDRGKTMGEMKKLSQNRKKWKEFINETLPTP